MEINVDEKDDCRITIDKLTDEEEALLLREGIRSFINDVPEYRDSVLVMNPEALPSSSEVKHIELSDDMCSVLLAKGIVSALERTLETVSKLEKDTESVKDECAECSDKDKE